MRPNHEIVSREQWLNARKTLLSLEKEETKLRDKVRAERLSLPWVKVEKTYTFETPEGHKTLADLFDGRSQLIVYHFMYGPDWEAGCPGCSCAVPVALPAAFLSLPSPNFPCRPMRPVPPRTASGQPPFRARNPHWGLYERPLQNCVAAASLP